MKRYKCKKGSDPLTENTGLEGILRLGHLSCATALILVRTIWCGKSLNISIGMIKSPINFLHWNKGNLNLLQLSVIPAPHSLHSAMHPQIHFHTNPFIPGASSSPSSADRGSSSRWHFQSLSAVSCWGQRSSSHLSSAPLVTKALSFLPVRPVPDCSCGFLALSCWRRLRWWDGELESKEERREFILWYFGSWNPGRSLRTWLEAKMLGSPVTERSEAGLFLSQHCGPCLLGSCQHQWCAVGSEEPLLHSSPLCSAVGGKR